MSLLTFLLYHLIEFLITAMAGNIIPAIATSNAITAGLIVLMAINVVRQQLSQCQSIYLRKCPTTRGFIMCRENKLPPPKPNCSVCSQKPTVSNNLLSRTYFFVKEQCRN